MRENEGLMDKATELEAKSPRDEVQLKSLYEKIEARRALIRSQEVSIVDHRKRLENLNGELQRFQMERAELEASMSRFGVVGAGVGVGVGVGWCWC